MKQKKITFTKNTSSALTEQNMKENDPYEFPFTCNPYSGCFFACKYCYVQEKPFRWQAKFGEEVKVKSQIVERLDKDLKKYSGIPQYLKRVQVGNATECFLPTVLKRSKEELGTDIMRGMLETFERHWKKGNKWMAHIVTKSHLILRYKDILERMKHMVQVELTMVCPDEATTRIVEVYSPTFQKRLNVIKELADEGIFVRVMAMPWLLGKDEALQFRKSVLKIGARGFKHKGLNYFDRDELLKGNTVEIKKRKDIIFHELLLNSGEMDDNGRIIKVRIPKHGKTYWKRLGTMKFDYEERQMPVLKSGYAELNDVDWGYLI